jgi:hypothetical protein
VLPTVTTGAAYHAEQDWGMDALNVKDTCGLGGATLYVNGKAYPVYSPNGQGPIKWSKRLVSETPDNITVELLAENVGPKDKPYTVRFTCQALAGRPDSPIQIKVEGGAPSDTLELGVGIRTLPQENVALEKETGILANWGIQDPAIGWVGLGVMYPKDRFLRSLDTSGEHQVIMSLNPNNTIGYHIQATWLKGRRFNRCPGFSNWLADLRATAEKSVNK